MSQSTTNPPSSGSSVTDSELTNKLIGILADTANGCLVDWGYHPGILRKLKELEQANVQWKEENIKLFRDNRQLAQLTHAQKERLKLATGSDISRMTKITELESQVRRLTLQNHDLRNKNELVADYQNLSNVYRAAMNEIHNLQRVLHSKGAIPSDFQKIHGAGSPRSPMDDLRRLPESSLPVNQGVVINVGPSAPGSNQAVSIPMVPYGALRAIEAPSNPIQPTKQVHPQPIAVVTPRTKQGIAPSAPAATHTTYITPEPLVAAWRHAGNKSSELAQANIFTPSTQPISPLGRTSSCSSQSPTTETEVTPRRDNDESSISAQQTSHIHNVTPQKQQDPQTTPNVNPPITAIRNLPSDKLNIASASATPKLDLVTDKSLSPPESIEVATPLDDDLITPTVLVVSAPVGVEPLKRVRDATEVDPTISDNVAKRPRLNEDQDEIIIQEAAGEQDESDVEVEIGPDGLRTVKSCLSALIESSEENEELQSCKLCTSRYVEGYISELPKPFLHATEDELVQHLTTEHEEAWEILRHLQDL